MKIHLTAIVKVKTQYREEVLAVLQHMVLQTRKEQPCELYNLHQSMEDENIFVFHEIWKNTAGLDAHQEQPYMKDFNSLINEKLQEAPILFKTRLH